MDIEMEIYSDLVAKNTGGYNVPIFFAKWKESGCLFDFQFSNWSLLITQKWNNGESSTQYWNHCHFEKLAIKFLEERGYSVSKSIRCSNSPGSH